MGEPRPILCLFSSFQTNIAILTTNKCEKCLSSIRRRDLNSLPSDCKSHPLTTTTGLPPNKLYICHWNRNEKRTKINIKKMS